jgi:uncharacterized membrane protein YfcA
MLGSRVGAQNARRVKSQYIILLLIAAAAYLFIQMLLKIKSGAL